MHLGGVGVSMATPSIARGGHRNPFYVFYKNVLRFLQKRMTKGVTNETPFPFFTKMDEREGSREV